VVDAKDKRLLYELEVNCRQSIPQIAKKVGLSKTAVVHRIQRLKEQKVISDFAAITNGNRLGYSSHTVFLKLQSSTKETTQGIVDFIKSLPSVGWCVHVLGTWDILFAVLARDLMQVQQHIETIESRFHQTIKDKEILFNVNAHAWPHKYLYDDFTSNFFYDSYGANHTLIPLSENEYAVLNQLRKTLALQLS